MKIRIKNIIHILLFLFVESVLVYQLINDGTNDILKIIVNLSLGIFAYLGLLEIMFRSNLTILLPEFYLDSSKNTCVNSELNKIASSSVEDIALLLNLTVDEFKLLLSIKKEEYSSYKNEKSSETLRQKELENKVNSLLYVPTTITTSKKLKSTSIPEINYYINFLDVMYNSKFSDDIIQVMCDFIKLKIVPEKLEKINYIIIPYDSNLLFGAGVARKLNKKAIKVLKDIPDYHLEKNWEGCSFDSLTEENSMILHDTLYTGRQVIESCKILFTSINNGVEKAKYSDLLFFSLCARKSKDATKYGIKILKEKGFIVNSIVEFNDKDIEKKITQ